MPVHDFLDSSKAAFPDNRHRALTHNSWFIFVVEKCFGHEIDLTCVECGRRGGDRSKPYEGCKKCAGAATGGKAKVRYICEQHILEDFGGKFIPTAGDYLEGLEFHDWMNNGIKGAPTSHRKLSRTNTTTTRRAFSLD